MLLRSGGNNLLTLQYLHTVCTDTYFHTYIDMYVSGKIRELNVIIFYLRSDNGRTGKYGG
jgi:hypothetical protein